MDGKTKRCPRPRATLLAAAVLVGGLALMGCSAAGTSATAATPDAATRAATTQTSEGGTVKVAATWGGKAAGPVFQVTFDTHTGSLGDYDLRTLATLRVNGQTELAPVDWQGPADGHHGGGTLTFPNAATDGTPVIGPDTRTLDLVVRDVGGVPERRFQWQL